MTQLFIDEKQVVLPVDFKITINKENTAITERTDHTFEIEIPLSFPENRAMFMFIDRITSPLNDPTGKPARLMVDRKEVIAGKVILIGVEPDLLTIQIVTKNSLWNGIIDPEVMFEDFPMATPDKVTGEFPTKINSPGRKFEDGATCDMSTGSQSDWKIKYTGQQWMYVPTKNSNRVMPVNHNDINHLVDGPLYEAGSYPFIKQFFLKPFLIALFKSKGYSVVDEFFMPPYDRLWIPTDIDIKDDMGMNLILSGIKVVSFLQDLEMLFDITFVIGVSEVVIRKNAGISKKIESLEVTDDYMMDVQDLEPDRVFAYKLPNSSEYKLHASEVDIRSRCINFDQQGNDLSQIVNFYHYGFINNTPGKSEGYIIPYAGDQPTIDDILVHPSVDEQGKVVAADNFRFFHRIGQYRPVNIPSFKKKYECNVIPAATYVSRIAYNTLGENATIVNFQFPYELIIPPPVKRNENSSLIDVITNGSVPKFSVEYVSLAFFSGWQKASHEKLIYPKGLPPQLWLGSIRVVCSYASGAELDRMVHYIDEIPAKTYPIYGGNNLIDYWEGTLKLANGLKSQKGDYDNIDYEHAYTFTFLSRVNIDPYSKFMIKGQPYVMESCELTATAKGLNLYATGVFYKVVDKDG